MTKKFYLVRRLNGADEEPPKPEEGKRRCLR
jgi:hypothetical protein